MNTSNDKKNIHLRKWQRELRLRGKLTSDEQIFPPLVHLPSRLSKPHQQNGSSPQQKQSSLTTSILGKDINTGKLVSLEQEARQRGLYVIGKPGSGKTTLLVNLILQDIEAGHGVCFLDAHGDAI